MSGLSLFIDQREQRVNTQLPHTTARWGSIGCGVLWAACFSRSYSVQVIPTILYQGLVLSLLQESVDASLIALLTYPLSNECDDGKERIVRYERIAQITVLSSIIIVTLARAIAQTPYLQRGAFLLPPLAQIPPKLFLFQATIRLWHGGLIAISGGTKTEEKKKEEKTEEKKQRAPITTLNPRKIKARLDEHIIGQEEAKKCLAVAVFNHRRRCQALDEGREVDFGKSNVMLIGPTGSGKTLLAKTLADILDVPFTIYSAKNLSEVGYVGEDVNDIIRQLFRAAGNNVKRAERGIVYIDEIDKLRCQRTGGSKDISGKGVQDSLLTVVDGSKVDVAHKSGRAKGGKDMTVRTDHILFIIGGAFENLNKIVGKRLGLLVTDDCLAEATPDDLVEYGMTREFVGRFNSVATLEKPSIELLRTILTEPQNAVVKQFQAQLIPAELEFTDEALDAIAEEAKKQNTGARALRTIVERTLNSTMFEALSDLTTINKIIVTEENVTGGTQPEIIRKSTE